MIDADDNMNQDAVEAEAVDSQALESQEGAIDGAAESVSDGALRASSAVEKRMGQPQQGEMPFAVVLGEAVTELPRDLYIPPRALEVFLEAFEGPLDLLLFLIRRAEIDIHDIPIVSITGPRIWRLTSAYVPGGIAA